MEMLVVIVVVVALLFFMNRGKDFDDPKPMSDQHLLAAIAGQADWLEKMASAPIDTQKSQSIIELARKRRGYIARMCIEVSDGRWPEQPRA